MRADRPFRSFVVTGILSVTSAGMGCSIRLDTTPPPIGDAGADALAELAGCVPLAGAATRVTGRLESLTVAGGAVLIVVAAALIAGDSDTFVFAAPTPDAAASFGDCLENAVVSPVRPAIAPTALNPSARPRPLGAITIAGTGAAAGESYLYFEAIHADGLGSDGFGVARWDGPSGRFGAPVLLWTADRPSFGSGVGLDGGLVYVIGGRAGGFLSADLFVARVPLERVALAGAYEYAQGGGAWGPDPDAAAPFAEGGTSPSLAYYPARGRWLLAYATPLAHELTLRSGLGPAGPWSLPVTLGRCALPKEDPGAFCVDVVLHPSLPGRDPDEIVLSYGAGTFGAPAGVPERAYDTRLVRARWPPDLP